MEPISIGQQAEHIAKDYLTAQGLTFVAHNFSCKAGEIDLIFRDRKVWVFVEVKNRKNTTFGHPLEWITATKQRKIIKTAQYFLRSQQQANAAMRFDAISLINLNRESLEWIPNAFISTSP